MCVSDERERALAKGFNFSMGGYEVSVCLNLPGRYEKV